jgi:hypothetical protein
MTVICETIQARGHPLVSATHRTTFEITKEQHLTTAGDCIIAISADKGLPELSNEFKDALAHDNAVLYTSLCCEEYEVVIKSAGSMKMPLTHPTDLVWRRSTFVCERTIGIQADTTAALLPRDLISALKNEARIAIYLEVRLI